MSEQHQLKQLTRLIESVGGTVELTNKRHLKVTGPKGVAYIQSGIVGRRSAMNARARLRKFAGIDITV